MLLFKKNPNITVIISCFFCGTYWVPLRFVLIDLNPEMYTKIQEIMTSLNALKKTASHTGKLKLRYL